MNGQSSKVPFYVGIFCIGIWILDALNILFFLKNPSYLLWYSSLSLLITGVALLSKNRFLISLSFCAFFLIEFVWTIEFFSKMFLNQSLIGSSDEALGKSLSSKDFYISLYHLVIPPASLVGAVFYRPDKNAWIGASIFALSLGSVSYLIASPIDNINCIYQTNYCLSVNFFEKIGNPYRILAGVLILTAVVYIPSQIILNKISDITSSKTTKI